MIDGPGRLVFDEQDVASKADGSKVHGCGARAARFWAPAYAVDDVITRSLFRRSERVNFLSFSLHACPRLELPRGECLFFSCFQSRQCCITCILLYCSVVLYFVTLMWYV